MKKGISQEQLAIIKCPETRDLIFKLLASPSVRLGAKKGFEEILEHDYFNVPEFCTAKDIYDGEEELDASNPDF